jgi:hypothetical protein
MLKDLVDFKNRQLELYQNELYDKDSYINRLETYIFELCAENCPEDYKRIIKNELLKED